MVSMYLVRSSVVRVLKVVNIRARTAFERCECVLALTGFFESFNN